MTDPKDCKHEATERDICNVGYCVACGTCLGIGYAYWEYPPDMSQPYWGIDRSIPLEQLD